MYQALYRSRRPEVFSEVLGQKHIIKILKHQIETDTVSHAYLFCGTRGTGKTTVARLLAKAVNCTSKGERPCGRCPNCEAIARGSFMDVIEIDAASNNGVENIRELRESVKYPPQAGSKKVYIVDEVHMLSSGAFNALLKTLEEPPENVIFILCTTEPQKLPQTILSRCMRLDFKRVPQDILAADMRAIADQRGVSISEGAIRLLAANADGSVRDGLSILDQVLASGDKEIDRDKVLEYLGTVGTEFFTELTELVSQRNTGEALALLDKALSDGKDAKQLMKDWNAHYRNLMITKFMRDPEDLLNMSEDNIKKVREQSAHISFEEIEEAIRRISKTINDARWSTQPRILLELDIVALSGAKGRFVPVEEPVSRPEPVLTEAPRPKVETPVERPVERPEERPEAMAEKPVAESKEPESEAEEPVNEAREPEGTAAGPQPEPSREAGNESNSEPAASTEAPGQEDGRSNDLNRLWEEIMDEGETTGGSFNLIRSWTRLKGLRQNTYTIAVATEFAAKYVREKLDTIDKIVSSVLKRSLRGSVVVENLEEVKKEQEPGTDYAKEIRDAIGIDIKLED
ncbi:MAG: DNA polymerase III subunit gamma/tau [Firmicutes bacterium]|nr:DNA polymerase III subunit gamma/tau [Bacillota bacterium]MBQ1431228.1 DNA polymerase III subunit gamma/tau [Bacillota bacterium]MBQ1630712.1 DNA polymerase III subunit gamma/tau [Bacillota bacterium]MBQ1690104.1 DNA polymerase III subunit gamma/tau [Bacillota bacterium]MBQ1825223.1 DNA polymerase III subunit gamma/tau [Bacillota bacterium]